MLIKRVSACRISDARVRNFTLIVITFYQSTEGSRIVVMIMVPLVFHLRIVTIHCFISFVTMIAMMMAVVLRSSNIFVKNASFSIPWGTCSCGGPSCAYSRLHVILLSAEQ